MEAGADVCGADTSELCNGVDDNCNGAVDEGFTQRPTFETVDSAVSVLCSPSHAFGQCVAGQCKIAVDGCESGWIDLNLDPVDDCEYSCTPTGAEVCDSLDNDCDGQTDEGFDLQGSTGKSWSRGHACSFPGATPNCIRGVCELSACLPDRYNIDGHA